MKRDDYVYASTRIRIFEKDLLTDDFYKRMLESPNLEAAWELLRETKYVDAVANVDHPANFEEALDRELVDQVTEIEDLAMDESLHRLLFLKYDYHNIKILIKEHLNEEEYPQLHYKFGSLYIPELKEWIESSSKNPNQTHLQKAIEEARAVYEETQDAQYLDFVLDKAYFEEFFLLAEDLESDYFINYAKNYADFTNVLAYYRLRYQNQTLDVFSEVLVDGGNISSQDFIKHFNDSEDDFYFFVKTSKVSDELLAAYNDFLEDDDITAFEKARDEYAVDMAIKGASIPYGPEVIYSYMIRLETEIQNLRIILSGKRAELDSDIIEERIRTHA